MNARAVLPATPPAAARLWLRRLRGPAAPSYYYWAPGSSPDPGRLLVAVHGIARDAREQALAWRPLAQRLGCAIVAPVFDRLTAPGYQQLGWGGARRRADRLLDAIVADASVARDGAAPRLLLTGYSGGAQFCHRYALARPDRVEALIGGAAGWYTWPSPAQRWPLGTDTAGVRGAAPIDLDAFLRVPTLVYVGDDDVARDASLRADAELDAAQGADRRERASRWVDALRVAARERGLAPRAQLRVLPGVAHQFSAAARAGIVDLVAQWLPAALSHEPGPAPRGPLDHGADDEDPR